MGASCYLSRPNYCLGILSTVLRFGNYSVTRAAAPLAGRGNCRRRNRPCRDDGIFISLERDSTKINKSLISETVPAAALTGRDANSVGFMSA